jgi:dTDP-4-dehydrorhamnose reductase
MSRWLVTGAGGMLGRELVGLLKRRGEAVTGLTHRELDVTDPSLAAAALQRNRPEVVVNCAAWTAVDLAEAHEREALAVNGRGAANVAAACASAGARMVQVSTDYVFDGTARRPYAEDHPPSPRSAYGRTKLAGEQAVLEQLPGAGYVVRTAWLYGAHGTSFVNTMISLEREQPQVAVVDDQHGQPTSTAAVAERIIMMIASGAPAGIYHATCSGETTWFGLACEVFRLLGADPARVTATTTGAVRLSAPRPEYSVLGHHGWACTGLPPLEHWRPVLGQAFPKLAVAARNVGIQPRLSG